jgi:hypothetical protein
VSLADQGTYTSKAWRSFMVFSIRNCSDRPNTAVQSIDSPSYKV